MSLARPPPGSLPRAGVTPTPTSEMMIRTPEPSAPLQNPTLTTSPQGHLLSDLHDAPIISPASGPQDPPMDPSRPDLTSPGPSDILLSPSPPMDLVDAMLITPPPALRVQQTQNTSTRTQPRTGAITSPPPDAHATISHSDTGSLCSSQLEKSRDGRPPLPNQSKTDTSSQPQQEVNGGEALEAPVAPRKKKASAASSQGFIDFSSPIKSRASPVAERATRMGKSPAPLTQLPASCLASDGTSPTDTAGFPLGAKSTESLCDDSLQGSLLQVGVIGSVVSQ